MKKLLNPIRFDKPFLKFDLKMKLTTLFLFTAMSVIQASVGYSQKTKVSLNINNMSVAKVIEKIESTTDFNFVYNVKSVDLDRSINIKVKNENIETVLKLIFKNTSTEYKISGTHVVLMAKKVTVPEEIIPIKKNSNVSIVKGKVTDAQGIPLPGTTVSDTQSSTIVTTDFNGDYEITVVNLETALKFSFVGFKTQIIKVAGKSIINAVLELEKNEMDELVIIGYGTTTKRTSTGSVSTITKKEIEKQPVSNVFKSYGRYCCGSRCCQYGRLRQRPGTNNH